MKKCKMCKGSGYVTQVRTPVKIWKPFLRIISLGLITFVEEGLKRKDGKVAGKWITCPGCSGKGRI